MFPGAQEKEKSNDEKVGDGPSDLRGLKSVSSMPEKLDRNRFDFVGWRVSFVVGPVELS